MYDIFPVGSVYRAMYSVDVMLAQLIDLAKLGIADGAYNLRCVHLLLDLFTDADRPFVPELLVKVSQGLVKVFQGQSARIFIVAEMVGFSHLQRTERPTIDVSQEYIKDPLLFVKRSMNVLQRAILLPTTRTEEEPELPDTRANLAVSVFDALLEAVRLGHGIGQYLTVSEDVSNGLANLLLDDDWRIRRGVALSVRKFCQDPDM